MIELYWGDEFIEYYGDCRRQRKARKSSLKINALLRARHALKVPIRRQDLF